MVAAWARLRQCHVDVLAVHADTGGVESHSASCEMYYKRLRRKPTARTQRICKADYVHSATAMGHLATALTEDSAFVPLPAALVDTVALTGG